MSLNRSDSCIEIAEERRELLDLLMYEDQENHRQLNEDGTAEICKGIKSIIKWSQFNRFWRQPAEETTKQKKKKKSVVFRDPLCEVRLYDKVAAKRQQWGHATKFCRVKRFCWDREVDLNTTLYESKDDLWLMDEKDEEYRKMMWRDMQKRRLNRKRRQTGQDLEFMVQRLEISANCHELVTSKMRRTTMERM